MYGSHFEVAKVVTFVKVKKKNTFFYFFSRGKEGEGKRRKGSERERGYRFRTVVKETGVGHNNTWKHH